MTAEIGLFLLIAALLLALLQASYLLPAVEWKSFLQSLLSKAAWLEALCIACAFGALIVLRVESDFSVANVAAHSNQALPLLYKITGAWGNHEGSMVLWVLVLALFGLALALNDRSILKSQALAVQALLAAGALLFIIFTSNPFARQFPVPADGAMLNPILQDIALALHPPMLYVGYVGFSLVFSLAVAALLTGCDGRSFARVVRPWIMAAWTALTLGIGLGSWWAYRELGWGGFWFWDPVENASLLPWLAGTALLHSNIVLEKRGQLAAWVILLAILTFGLSMLGTFLVRSGALISVHSFASDPARGLFILAYLAIAVGGALLLYGLRAQNIRRGEPMSPLSREGMIVFNNLFLLSACAIVLIGTLYPLVSEWLGGARITVGPPYFNATFVPLMALPLLLAGLAPLAAWKKTTLAKMSTRMQPAALATGAALLIALAWADIRSAYGLLGIGLAAWLLASSLLWLKNSWGSLPRLYALSVFTAHGGAAVLIIGITGTGLWQQEVSKIVSPGERISISGYEAVYVDEILHETPNYTARIGELSIMENGRQVATLKPEYRTYALRGTVTHEASIRSGFGGDLYAVMGEASVDGNRTALRIYYNPMAWCLWIGCLLMGAAGLLSLLRGRRQEVLA